MPLQTYYVRFWSENKSEDEFIGPFYDEDEAWEFADYQNTGLGLNGIPTSVACYSVV